MEAITWSCDGSMVVRQTRKLEDVELIFGCNAMVDKQVCLSALATWSPRPRFSKPYRTHKWGREISDRMEASECNVDDNLLIVRCKSGDRNAENVMQGIEMMLPPRFQPEFSPGMLTCSLREIEVLCGVKFSQKESWWRKLFG